MVSVIIPVYKVENYLHRCVDSVINQTYHNLEIILVDDGSPDNCPEVCDEYTNKDARVRVIHKKNEGLGYARNSGFDIAKGDYIVFVDSDDYLPNNAIEILVSNINDADVCCGEHIIFEKYLPKYKNSGKCEVLCIRDVFKNILNVKLPYNYQWGKLYKKELFKNIRYSNQLYEDVEINYRLLSQCAKIMVCHDIVYFYNRGNISSITIQKFNERHFNQITTAKLLTENVERKFPELKPNCRKYFCNINLAVMTRLIKNKRVKDFPTYYFEIMHCFAENKKYLFTDLSLKRKLKTVIKIIAFDFYFMFTKRCLKSKVK